MNSAQLFKSALFFQKLAQDPNAVIQDLLAKTLQNIPGTKLVSAEVAPEHRQVNIRVEVPEQHSFTANQLSATLTDAIQSVAPGYKVVSLLSFTTKTAQLATNDLEMGTKTMVMDELKKIKGAQLLSFVLQPETKHVLVEVKAAPEHNFTGQQLSAYLTKLVQDMAPGYTVIATLNF